MREAPEGSGEFGSDVVELKIIPSTPSFPRPALEVFEEPSPDREGNSVASASCPEHRGDLSIDGLVFVIDPGFSKQNVYTPHPSGVTALPRS